MILKIEIYNYLTIANYFFINLFKKEKNDKNYVYQKMKNIT